MTVEEIIRMFQNPETIGDALIEAEKLPFPGNDQFLFNLKRQKFTVGMSDNEKLNWVGEMIIFLSAYKSISTNISHTHQFGNYQSDTFNRWHYLDKQNLRKRLKKICRDKDNPVKVLFIENNTDAFSDYTDEILRSFIKADHGTIHAAMTKTKGDMNQILYFESSEQLREDWTDFMGSFFGVSVSNDKISENFRQLGFHKESHIIVLSVDHIDKNFPEYFQVYYNFWSTLQAEQPIFLCIHLPEHSLPKKDLSFSSWVIFYYEQYETVQHLDFIRFFNAYRCYQRDEELCKSTPMCFGEAVKKLQFCQP